MAGDLLPAAVDVKPCPCGWPRFEPIFCLGVLEYPCSGVVEVAKKINAGCYALP